MKRTIAVILLASCGIANGATIAYSVETQLWLEYRDCPCDEVADDPYNIANGGNGYPSVSLILYADSDSLTYSSDRWDAVGTLDADAVVLFKHRDHDAPKLKLMAQDISLTFDYTGVRFGGLNFSGIDGSDPVDIVFLDGIIATAAYWDTEHHCEREPEGYGCDVRPDLPMNMGNNLAAGIQGSNLLQTPANDPPYAIAYGNLTASIVPIPATAWLFATGLGFLGWVRRMKL